MQALKEIGCRKVNLQIRSSNIEVAAFYKSLGFIIEERISMYYKQLQSESANCHVFSPKARQLLTQLSCALYF
jgi:ribosomal protein S18 acetylase RimI-like enzyme